MNENPLLRTLHVLQIIIHHDGPDLLLNPNQLSALSLVPHIFFLLKPLPKLISDISTRKGCVRYHDHEGVVTLTIDELGRLAGLRLEPWQCLRLRQTYGERHIWHDDFYDSDGYALQRRPEL